MKFQAKQEVKLVSVSAYIDFAAAKKIHLAVEGGASITIDGGITVECPGIITTHASKKSFSGPVRMGYTLPVLPNNDTSWVDVTAHYDDAWNTAWPLDKVKVEVNSKAVAEGISVDSSRKNG